MDFLPGPFSSADSYDVRAAHVCHRMHQPLGARVQNPEHWPPYHRLDVYTKTLHTLIGMGSAALAAALLHPGKATRTIFPQGTKK